MVPHSPTLASRLGDRDNSFGLLRLVFAGFVIISHGFPIGGFGPDPTRQWWNDQTDIGHLGLLGFFVISGFLITRSAVSNDTLKFLWRRFLRIYPAFAVVLVFGAVVVAPWFYFRAHGSLAGYWTTGPGGPVTYVIDNARLAIRQFGLHDVFLFSPYGVLTGEDSVNGSLWTLWYEFRAYLIVGALAALGLLTRARWLAPLGAGGLLVLLWFGPHISVLSWLGERILGSGQGLQLGLMFFIGASFSLYAEQIPLHGVWAALGSGISVLTLFTTGFVPVGFIAYGYVVLWLAAGLPTWTRWVGVRNDYSYGTYLYAWPVQTSLATYGLPAVVGYLGYQAVVVVITAGLAWLSWHVVEKQAMRLKSRGPGRGVAFLGLAPEPTNKAPATRVRWVAPVAAVWLCVGLVFR